MMGSFGWLICGLLDLICGLLGVCVGGELKISKNNLIEDTP